MGLCWSTKGAGACLSLLARAETLACIIQPPFTHSSPRCCHIKWTTSRLQSSASCSQVVYALNKGNQAVSVSDQACRMSTKHLHGVFSCRVHARHLGHPLLCDATYGGGGAAALNTLTRNKSSRCACFWRKVGLDLLNAPVSALDESTRVARNPGRLLMHHRAACGAAPRLSIMNAPTNHGSSWPMDWPNARREAGL